MTYYYYMKKAKAEIERCKSIRRKLALSNIEIDSFRLDCPEQTAEKAEAFLYAWKKRTAFLLAKLVKAKPELAKIAEKRRETDVSFVLIVGNSSFRIPMEYWSHFPVSIGPEIEELFQENRDVKTLLLSI